MSSLRQLLASCSSTLLLDAASSRIQVGVLSASRPWRWESSSDEAGVGVFDCLERLNVDLSRIDGFLFCDGPGSILGIRTVAMALRTWKVLQPRPIHAYSSLALVAEAQPNHELTVIADARRDSWHSYRRGSGLRRVPAAELAGDLVMPEHFKHWSTLPGTVRTTPYEVADCLPRVLDVDLFLATDAPDAFLHEEPSYVTWTPQIHRAPA